jgi:hypothetical protein
MVKTFQQNFQFEHNEYDFLYCIYQMNSILPLFFPNQIDIFTKELYFIQDSQLFQEAPS